MLPAHDLLPLAAALDERELEHESKPDWLRRVGVINDYVRIPYANGSSFASQFLYRELSRRGHRVTIIGPSDPLATAAELPKRHIAFPSVPLRNHPGVRLALPGGRALRRVAREGLNLLLAQTGSALLDLGPWLRHAHGVPLLCVNTVHLPSVYNVLLPDRLNGNPEINALFRDHIVPAMERQSALAYNAGDGLIVLSESLRSYWQERGVTVPIHVIPRSVEPRIFDGAAGADPFSPQAPRGGRLLVVCRHSREKGLRRLLEIFARSIAPKSPNATLTLVGDGPDHDAFKRAARSLGVEDRCFFPGEFSLNTIPSWYRHADVFLYTSLSETYGQVVSEAMWCALPVVALADGMGVSQQIRSGETGILVPNRGPEELVNQQFAAEALALLADPGRRQALGRDAERVAREQSSPARWMERHYLAFEAARERREHDFDRPDAPEPYLARWAAIHTALALLGCLRKPATLNRHGRKPPQWNDLLDGPARATVAAGAPPRSLMPPEIAQLFQALGV